VMKVDYQEGHRLFLSIECLNGNYEDCRIAIVQASCEVLYARVFLPRVRRSL
jgi:hypothetical protein